MVPELGTKMFGFMEPKFIVCDYSRTIWVANGMIHAMDGILMCVRPGSVEKYGFTK